MGGIQLSYKMIPYIGAGVVAVVLISLFIYLLTVQIRDKRNEVNFNKQLDFSINPEDEQEEKESFLKEKMRTLPELLIKAKMVNESTRVEDIQKRIFLIGSIIFLFATLITRNPLGGLIPLVFIYAGVTVFAMFKISKIKGLMNEQIPAFISTFKANIQANQHAQNAMINAIDNTASPLYDELARSRAIMEAGDFRPGIIALRMNTQNETLRQMASCIELASVSGSNIEEQIEIIEDIIKSKQIIERKKRLGVNENKPLFYIAALMIPASFVGTYLISDLHKDYWFSTPTSYLILLGILIVMGLSSWATWKIIQKVDID